MTTITLAQADAADVFGPLAAVGLGIAFVFLLLVAAVVLFYYGYYRVFEKAGMQGWEALLPYHNLWVHLRIIGRPEKWALAPLAPVAAYLVVTPFLAIPILGIVIGIVVGLAMLAFVVLMLVLYCTAMLGLATSFGQSTGFGVGLILLPWVFIPILGLGQARYLGPAGPNPPSAHPLPVGAWFPAGGYGGYQAPGLGWGPPPGAPHPLAPPPQDPQGQGEAWGQPSAWGQPPQQPQPWGEQSPQWGEPPPQWREQPPSEGGQPPQGGPDLSK